MPLTAFRSSNLSLKPSIYLNIDYLRGIVKDVDSKKKKWMIGMQ